MQASLLQAGLHSINLFKAYSTLLVPRLIVQVAFNAFDKQGNLDIVSNRGIGLEGPGKTKIRSLERGMRFQAHAVAAPWVRPKTQHLERERHLLAHTVHGQGARQYA